MNLREEIDEFINSDPDWFDLWTFFYSGRFDPRIRELIKSYWSFAWLGELGLLPINRVMTTYFRGLNDEEALKRVPDYINELVEAGLVEWRDYQGKQQLPFPTKNWWWFVNQLKDWGRTRI